MNASISWPVTVYWDVNGESHSSDCWLILRVRVSEDIDTSLFRLCWIDDNNLPSIVSLIKYNNSTFICQVIKQNFLLISIPNWKDCSFSPRPKLKINPWQMRNKLLWNNLISRFVHFSLEQNQTQSTFIPIFNPLFNPKFLSVNFNFDLSLNTLVDTLNNYVIQTSMFCQSVKQIHDPEG